MTMLFSSLESVPATKFYVSLMWFMAALSAVSIAGRDLMAGLKHRGR